MDDVVQIGGRLFRRLAELSTDLGVLDRSGTWVVVLPFDGPPVCARFSSVAPAPRSADAVTGDAGPGSGGNTVGGSSEGPVPHRWATSLARPRYGAAVEDIRRRIARGDVYQVNLCRMLSTVWPEGADLITVGRRLAAGHPAPFAATVQLPSAATMVVSASPELFLRRCGDRVESRPIKGTTAPGAPFLDKDQAENVMIADLVRNDLGRVCRFGSVTVPSLCRSEAHSNLCHLVTTVRGTLRAGVGWPELLHATFPPGSVTGAPKLAALEVIRRLEPVTRGVYCGAVGWVDADRRLGELAVAIRTFEVSGAVLRYGAGGAVTWGSTATGEWRETELKASALLAAVGRATSRGLATAGLEAAR